MKITFLIENLGGYNDGRLVGEWFTPPLNYDEIAEEIGLSDEYRAYGIYNYELPLDIDEYTSIEEFNRLYNMIEEVMERFPENAIYDLLWYFGEIEDLYEKMHNLIHYPNCKNEYDIGKYFVEKEGYLDEVPEVLHKFIDYYKYGKEIIRLGDFIHTENGYYEIAWI